ncbi:MAG: ArsR/SmtB family transcription factor [Candidatus Thorarchaeota archaeon]
MTKAKRVSASEEFKENEMNDMISIFKTLSDPSRIRIISVLNTHQNMSVSDIADHLDLEISLVSHHLSTLKLQGFVKSRREKKQVFYSIDDDCIIDIMQRARDHVVGS